MRITARCGAALLCVAALATPTYAGRPQTYPNSMKYRDDGAKPATGRSGSAAIQARALRGLQQTDIEVTTGQFDTAVAPVGKLDKVQVKMLTTNGDVIVTDNYRKGELSGATGTFTYDWPRRGQAVQVQANVSGIDPKRTDVVTVDTIVKMRPDLIVASLSMPGGVNVGSSVTIDALIRERIGDLGARANCVLKIDGVEVDRANGIWVDARDAVTCEFRQTFNTLGDHRVTVEVNGVVPADYNTANNSRSATVSVYQPTYPIFYTLSAEDQHYQTMQTSTQHTEFVGNVPDPSFPPWGYVIDQTNQNPYDYHYEQFYASLQTYRAVTFPVTLAGSLVVDGQTLLGPSLTLDGTVTYGGDGYPPGYTATCGEENEYNQWFQVCDYHYDLGGGAPFDMTTVWISSRAGTVTYSGSAVSVVRYSAGFTDIYESNWGPYSYFDGDNLIPLPDSLGNNLVVHASVTDSSNLHVELEGAIQLYPQPDLHDHWDFGCSTFDYTEDSGHTFGEQCSYFDTTTISRIGFNNGTVYLPY